MSRRTIAFALLSLLAGSASALGPHELLLLVNKDSTRSVRIAHEFAEARRVPIQNIVYLNVPGKKAEPVFSMSPAEFSDYIWEPANKAVAGRGLSDHIRAWVYSVDFPLRIDTRPPISIQGMTLLGGRVPDYDEIDKALYVSPLFAGPHAPGGPVFPPQSFDVLKAWLGNDMPVPSMMLGVCGEYGNTTETILQYIRRGHDSDFSAPTGTVYLVTGNDIRAQARAWQFEPVRRELIARSVYAAVVDKPPSKQKAVMGVMMGAAELDPFGFGEYLPGSLADHLTSAAAVFNSPNQTKLSRWLEAGVTASAGTVSEPRAIWMKFPHARVYVHYAAGCTVMESYHQSVRSPLQILFVGEPLARPWAPNDSMVLAGLGAGNLSGTISLQTQIRSDSNLSYSHYMCMVDGKTVETNERQRSADPLSSVFELDTTLLPDGPHLLRVVAYGAGAVRNQVFAETGILVKN